VGGRHARRGSGRHASPRGRPREESRRGVLSRISELGFTLRPKRDPSHGERLAKLANPNISDLEKIGPERERTSDVFAGIRKAMADGVYDDMTCNLMRWFIAEEEDTGRRLDEAYACVRERAFGKRRASNGDMRAAPGPEAEAIMACMTQGFAKLEKSIEKLTKAARQNA
jgi:hypothetical protein